MEPKLIQGNAFSDFRGSIKYNNDFHATEVKRIYIIENVDKNYIRGWQGHRVEQRWFSAITGSFKIELLKISSIENPSGEPRKISFVVKAETLDVLHVPAGYVSAIKAMEGGSRLLAMADHFLGEVQDEIRFDLNKK